MIPESVRAAYEAWDRAEKKAHAHIDKIGAFNATTRGLRAASTRKMRLFWKECDRAGLQIAAAIRELSGC